MIRRVQRFLTVSIMAALATGGCSDHVSSFGGVLVTPQPTAACTGSDSRAAGSIAFSTSLDAASLDLGCVVSSLPDQSPWAWRAQFAQPVTPGTISIVIARVSGSTEQAVFTGPQTVSGPNTIAFGAQGDAGFFGQYGPGEYIMRVLAGTTVLAEGRIKVTP
jgi:hypothetical protein